MILDHAIRESRIRANPCTGVDLPSAASPEMLFLTDTEVRLLAASVDACWKARRRASLPATEPPPYGLLVEFAAFTGLRAGEIAALRVGDLDLRRGNAFVTRSASRVKGQLVEGTPKTKAGRRMVLIGPALCDRLRAHLGDRVLDRAGYVFAAADGGPLNYGTFYGLYFRRAVQEALPTHLHGLRFHDLRHTYASLLVEQGAHPKEMAELMGHASVQITLDRYSHVMPHLTATLAERLDAAYRAADPAGITPAAEPAAVIQPLRRGRLSLLSEAGSSQRRGSDSPATKTVPQQNVTDHVVVEDFVVGDVHDPAGDSGSGGPG